MVYDFDKNKINSAGTPEVTSTPSVSPVPTEAPKPPNVKLKGQFYQPQPPKDNTPTERQETEAADARARSSAANAAATEEIAQTKAAALAQNQEDIITAAESGDLATIESVKPDSANTNKSETTQELQTSEKALNYASYLSKKDKTIYQKTSAILDEYLKNHPDEYTQYSQMNEAQKRKFRDEEMGKLFRKLTGKQNINQIERKNATRDLAILLITAESKGLSLKELNQNPQEMKKIIADGDKALFNNLIANIDTANPDKALNDIAELYYTFTDPEYLLLEGSAKQNYLKTHSNKLLNIFGINNVNAIPVESKANAANIMKGILTELSEKDMTIKDLTNLPASKQSQFLVTSLEKYETEHPEAFNKLMPQTKQAFEILKSRNQLIKELGKEDPTERDLYILLQQKAKNGQISEQERKMLDSYKLMDAAGKNKGVDFLKGRADMTSNTAKIMVTGMSYEAQFKHQLDGIDDPAKLKEIVTEIAQGTNNDFDKVMQLEALRKVLMNKGMKAEEIMKLLPEDLAQSITAGALSHPDKEQAAAATDVIASFNNPVMNDTANATVMAMSEVRSPEWLKYYGANVQTTQYDEAFTTGINNNLDANTANQVFSFIASNATTEAKKTSIVEFSLTTTNDTERIKAYTESYKTIESPAVTEGMAAAAYNTTNPQNAAIINSAVDYAIQNNGYSTSEINSINTARQTGNTSYTSTNTSVTNSSSEVKSNSKSTTSQGNTPASTDTSVQTAKSQVATTTATTTVTTQANTNKVIKLSSANSNAGFEIKEKLAQLQYEASVEKKEKALQDLQNIIDKIQNDKEVHAQKQAELKAKEAKTEEEIAQAIEEAQEKSVQQQKDDITKMATEVVETEISNAKLEKEYNIPIDTINKLRSAAKQGDLSTIYSELGNISADAQKHFIQYISRKDTATIIGFIRNRSTDKALIKELCRLNPGLIKSLDTDLLISCGLAKTDIIKYADSRQLSTVLYSLAKVGNTEQLKQFYEALGQKTEQSSVTQAYTEPVPGDDRYFANLHNNMSSASSSSISSNVVGNSRFPEGQTRQKIRPQDYPDYREYLV